MSRRISLFTTTPMTRAARVSVQLAAEIVAGRFPSGARLDEVAQSNRLGVSRTPLREAVRQLATLGLVENRPHRGVVVSPDAGEALFETLSEMEAMCVRLATERMAADKRAELEWLAADGRDWLGAIHRGCDNAVLVGMLETLWQPVLAGSAAGSGLMAPELDRVLARRIVVAIINGSRSHAEAGMRDYVRAAEAAFGRPQAKVAGIG
ncbi:MAG TPA: GntR family transcriptional regulator [Magnetospirillum sp.]|nr:GntR family transcriptional regulator [Magnetospirillum sp.]